MKTCPCGKSFLCFEGFQQVQHIGEDEGHAAEGGENSLCHSKGVGVVNGRIHALNCATLNFNMSFPCSFGLIQ